MGALNRLENCASPLQTTLTLQLEIFAPGPEGPPFAVRPRGRGSAAACDAQLES